MSHCLYCGQKTIGVSVLCDRCWKLDCAICEDLDLAIKIVAIQSRERNKPEGTVE